MFKTFKNVSVAVCALSAFALAQNVLDNGDLAYGDGGWYIWNNPDGPAKYEGKLGEKGLGVDGSEGVKVTVTELPNPSWGLQLQPPKWLADSTYYTLTSRPRVTCPSTPLCRAALRTTVKRKVPLSCLPTNGRPIPWFSLPTRQVTA